MLWYQLKFNVLDLWNYLRVGWVCSLVVYVGIWYLGFGVHAFKILSIMEALKIKTLNPIGCVRNHT